MRIDYDASWSSNIKLTDEMVDYAITNGYLSVDFWDDPRDYLNPLTFRLVLLPTDHIIQESWSII